MAKIVIIGGGVIGSATACYLALAGHAADVVVIEPDPTYEFAATPRATGGIRQLFTVPENILMAQYGHEVYGQFETLMAVDGDPAPIGFRREGYLWLGSGKDDVDSLMANWRIQTAHDVRVDLQLCHRHHGADKHDHARHQLPQRGPELDPRTQRRLSHRLAGELPHRRSQDQQEKSRDDIRQVPEESRDRTRDRH